MNKLEQKKCLLDMIAVAEQAGKLLVKYQAKLSKLTITTKEAQGVVSEADVNAENLIIRLLSKKYPHVSFLAEESAYKNGTIEKATWQWIIDPLDGTANFLNGLDYFAVCIALAHNGVPILGVVFRPQTAELFYAQDGKSFYKSRNKLIRLQLKERKLTLKDTMLATGFVSEKGIFCKDEFVLLEKILPKCRGVRRYGSAALDLCYVAKGVFNGFWERDLCPWDVAAAGLICQNAGATVTDWSKKSFNPFQQTIVAAPKIVYRSLIRLLQSGKR